MPPSSAIAGSGTMLWEQLVCLHDRDLTVPLMGKQWQGRRVLQLVPLQFFRMGFLLEGMRD